MEPEIWALAALAAFLVGLSKGGLSMMATLAVPVMALAMNPVLAAGLLLPVFVVSDLFGLIAWRRDVDWRVLLRVVPGSVLGVGLGWATASLVPAHLVGGLVGVIGAAFALWALIRPPLPDTPARHPRWLAGGFWGGVAGYTSFVSHSGAPPYQVYVQPLRLGRQAYAGTITVFFAITNAVKLIPYAALGQLSPQNLHIAASLVPAALAGVAVGVWAVRRVSERVFYLFITWALLAVSVKLMADAL